MKFKNLTLLSFFLCIFLPVKATHIVGGELNYKDLGNSNYEITLKLYKDCGTSIVDFNDPAIIYVYDGNNTILDTISIPIVERDTLDGNFADSCLVVPPEVCVDFAIYRTTYFLPPTPNGYTLAFIRCCRNQSILNAVGEDENGNTLPPDFIGATYNAKIPGTNATIGNNSNPVFNELPPIILCSGQTFTVDHSAFDEDGDAIVYSLCTPHVGGSLINGTVLGDPTIEFPPFEDIIWVDPYGLNNVMGGDIPLNINSSTGVLTGSTPNLIGQFVVGVCASEFRNGSLLSQTRRDFQFNIADCNKLFESDYEIVDGENLDTIYSTNGEMIEYILRCDSNLIVAFENLTEGTDITVWDFNDGSPLDSTFNPVHEFPDTGFYLITQIAQPGSGCADTFKQLVSIQYQDVVAEFDFGAAECYDPSTGLQFIDRSQDADEIDLWIWSFGDADSSEVQNPIHFYEEDGAYEVSLFVQERSGCLAKIDTFINIISIDPFNLVDSMALCEGDTIQIELAIDGEHEFLWSPAEFLVDATVQNPLAFPQSITTFTVEIFTVRESGIICQQTDQVVVLTDYPVPSVINNTDPLQCDSIVELNVESQQEESAVWSLSPLFIDTISVEELVEVHQYEEEQTYFVAISNQFCTTIDSIEIVQHGVFLEVEDYVICLFDPLDIVVEIASNNDELTYEWHVNGFIFNTSEPTIPVNLENSTTITLTVSNSSGCTNTQEIDVVVNSLPELEIIAEPLEVINEAEVFFNTIEDEDYQYEWQPQNLLNNANGYNPFGVVSETTTFILTVEDENSCVKIDSITINVVDKTCDEVNVFVPTAFSPNGDGLNDVFRIQGDVIEEASIEVFDRWGNTVYSSTDLSSTWDGTIKNKQLPSGVYGYLIQITCFGSETYVRKGNIELLR